MAKSWVPTIFIVGGIVTIVFHRTIASNALQSSRMFRVPLFFAEKDMPYYTIAIGVFMIVVGTLFLFQSLRL